MTDLELSQADVAKRVKVGADIVSRWLETDETKRRTKPSLDVAARLHKEFEIDPLDWSREADDAPASEPKPTSEHPNGDVKGVA